MALVLLVELSNSVRTVLQYVRKTKTNEKRAIRELWRYHDDNILEILHFLPRSDLDACELTCRKFHLLAERYRETLAAQRMRALPPVG